MTINLLSSRDQVILLCEKYYKKGWMPGSNGGIAVLSQTSNTRSIVFTPDNIPRESLKRGDLFEFKWVYDKQTVVKPMMDSTAEPHTPARNIELYTLVLSQTENTKCVAEVYSPWFALASKLALKLWEKNGNNHYNQVRLANWGLIDSLIYGERVLNIPIINNPSELTFESSNFLKENKAKCLMIKDSSAIVWDSNVESLNKRLEILEELCRLEIFEFKLL